MAIDPRFIQNAGREVFTGNELLVKGALETEGGVHLLTGYPGSPIASFFDTLTAITPLLEEHGMVAKLANNLLSLAAIATTAEAMTLAVKAGLDPARMIEVLNAGTGANSATRDKWPRAVLPRTFDFGFSAQLSLKDTRLALAEAQAMGVPLPTGERLEIRGPRLEPAEGDGGGRLIIELRDR